MRHSICIVPLILGTLRLSPAAERNDFMLGVDANYCLEMTDFLKFCWANPKIAGAFYWSPEWYGEGMWKAFALFDPEGNAQPALQAFHPTEDH